jgi:hypothetical protein
MRLLSDSLPKGDAGKLAKASGETNSELGPVCRLSSAEFLLRVRERLAEEVRERKAAEVGVAGAGSAFLDTIFEQAEQVHRFITSATAKCRR